MKNRDAWLWLSVIIVIVSRWFYPGREVSWIECIPDFAHMVIGALFVLACQGKKWMWTTFWALAIYECIMFAVFKGWLHG